MPNLWSVLIDCCSDRHVLQVQQDEAQDEVSRQLFSPTLQNQTTTTTYFSKWNIIIAIGIGFVAWYMISKGLFGDLKTASDAVRTETELWLEKALEWVKSLAKATLKKMVEGLQALQECLEK